MEALDKWLRCIRLAGACALLAALTCAVLRVPKILNQQLDATRSALVAEQRAWLDTANHRLIDALADLNGRASDAISTVNAVSTRADKRTGEALGIVRTSAANLDIQITGARGQVDGQLTALSNTAALMAQSTARLEDRYRTLPDEIRADREYQGLVAETMGVLGATKVTMGQAAVMAKVVAAETPKMTAHVESVAGSVEREADSLTAPKSFWANLRTWLLTIARLYGAL